MDFQSFLDNLVAWALTSGIKVVVILIVAWVATRVAKLVIRKVLRNLVRVKNGIKQGRFEGIDLADERLKTLEKVCSSVAKTAVWLIALITLLPEFGVNIGPLLAGLGIAGLALGFGARSLVADYISGLFILLEDQYRIGEEVDISGTKGKVKDFNLRRTVIEDENGVLNFVPNSQIKKASNFSRK